jgi:hypothetical protein
MARGPRKGPPARPNQPVIAKTHDPAPPPPPVTTTPRPTSPEQLFDDARRLIRERDYPAAKSALSGYLAAPALPKQKEARALLAELDHAVSPDAAAARAKGLGDDELMTYIDQGVKDLVAGISDQELKSDCSAILLEAFRNEKHRRLVLSVPPGNASPVPPFFRDERSRRLVNSRQADNAGRTDPPPGSTSVARSFPNPPPNSPSKAVSSSEPELGFSPIYNGRDFEGWGATCWRNLPPAKGGTGYFPCRPAQVVRRVDNALVANDVIGTLVTDKVYQFHSLRFNYKISPHGRRPDPKSKTPHTAHTIAELVLGQPMTVGNNAQCGVIMISLATADAGDVMTRKKRDARDTGMQSAQTRAGRPPGQWNEMEIKCSDKSVLILLNGVEVNQLKVTRRFNAKILFSFGGIELQLANIRVARHG